LKSAERSKPPLGWPRSTDSLCPICVREARARILSGEQSVETLVLEHVGEIRADILERDGRIIVEKTCPMHGTFNDTLAINPAFLERIERLFPTRLSGRCRQAARPRHLFHQVWARRRSDHRPHQPLQHDVRSVLHGRQPGRLRPRLTLDDVGAPAGRCYRDQAQAADDRAVLGGEPTISPIFLDAVRYARQV
jgi:hypothetical protein